MKLIKNVLLILSLPVVMMLSISIVVFAHLMWFSTMEVLGAALVIDKISDFILGKDVLLLHDELKKCLEQMYRRKI